MGQHRKAKTHGNLVDERAEQRQRMIRRGRKDKEQAALDWLSDLLAEHEEKHPPEREYHPSYEVYRPQDLWDTDEDQRGMDGAGSLNGMQER